MVNKGTKLHFTNGKTARICASGKAGIEPMPPARKARGMPPRSEGLIA
jgi:hypothetical protein